MDYKEIAKQARIKVLSMIFRAQTSHIGSNFSAIDIMAVLFEHIDLNKDIFVLSAGWKAAALYYFLWHKGKITEEELNSYCQSGSKFIGLAEPIIPSIKIAGGSMGLGLPGAIGLAFAKKIKREEGNVYVLMSDGEMQCGTFWESYLITSHHKLDNLIVIIDGNEYQAMGKVKDVLFVPSYWEDGFIDGHNYEKIESALIHNNWIYASTIKGRGVSFMENNNLYHYKQLSDEEYQKALQELK